MWRDGLDVIIPEYFPRKYPNVLKVTRAIYEHLVPGQEFDAQQFAKATGLKLPTVYRVLNEYGIGRLIFGCAPSYSQFGHGVDCDVLPGDSQSGNVIPHHYDQTENTVSGSGNFLLPFEDFLENLIAHVVIPRWNVEHNSPIPNKLLFEALGSSINSLELDAILHRIEAAVPQRYKSAVKALQLEVDRVWRILSDPKLTALAGWQHNYPKAIANRFFSACEGKPTYSKQAERETGLPRASLARAAKDDWNMEPVYGKPIEQDDPDDMPAPHSEHAFYRKVQIYNEDRTFRELDYTKAENRKAAAQAIRDGWRVATVPQTASIPRRKTAEQKAAVITNVSSEPRIKRPRKPTLTTPIPRAYIGYTEHEARRLAIGCINAIGDRVVTEHGEVIALDRLTNSQLIEVMKGNVSEVVKLYTPVTEIEEAPEPEEIHKICESAEVKPRRYIKPMPVKPGYYEKLGGFEPDIAAATATMNAYYAKLREQQKASAA